MERRSLINSTFSVVRIRHSVVRIRHRSGAIVGVGFLVDKRHIFTCVHVVADALDYPEFSSEPPQEFVQLDFPLVERDRMFKASVVLWRRTPENRDEDDIACLQLEEDAPAAAKTVTFASAKDVWKHEIGLFGFPVGHDNGTWSTGRLLGPRADNLIQIENTEPGSSPVLPGFSGGAVWDEQQKGVVGMVATTVVVPDGVRWRVDAGLLPGTRMAFMIPAYLLLQAWSLVKPNWLFRFKEAQRSLYASVINHLRSIVIVTAVILFIIALSGSAAWFVSHQPPRANYVTNDKDDGSIGSLRWAITNAKSGSTINFDPALTGKIIKLTSGSINIAQKNLKINDPAKNVFPIISNENNNGTINIYASASVWITNVTFQGSNKKTGDGFLVNHGYLSLKHCNISHNDTLESSVHNFSFIDITNSTITNNIVDDEGGALNNELNVNIKDSIISNNKARRFNGGGIMNKARSVLTMSDSIISNNNASDSGGGIFNSGKIDIFGSTIIGNIAGNVHGGGGGIFNNEHSNSFITNSTISNNTTNGSGGGIGFYKTNMNTDLFFCTVYNNSAPKGGGSNIFLDQPSSRVLHMKANIIAGNSKDSSIVGGEIVSEGYNIVQNMSNVTFAFSAAHQTDLSIDDSAKIFGPVVEIQSNSDRNATYALRPTTDNPAIGAIPQQACNDSKGHPITVDQRKTLRPHKNGAGKEFCDIGAYETVG